LKSSSTCFLLVVGPFVLFILEENEVNLRNNQNINYDTPHHPYYGGEARVHSYHTEELRPRVFPSLFALSSPIKS